MFRHSRLAVSVLRSLFAQPGKSALCIGVLVVAATSVTVELSIEEGVRTAMDRKLAVYGARVCSIYRNSASGSRQFRVVDADDLEALRRELGNEAVFAGTAAVSANVSAGGNTVRAVATGIDPEIYLVHHSMELRSGRLIDSGDSETIAKVAVVSEDLARVLFGTDDAINREFRVNDATFRVKGVIGLSGEAAAAADNTLLLQVPLRTALRRLIGESKLNMISYRVYDQADIDSLNRRVAAILSERHPVPPGEQESFFILTPRFLIDAFRASTRALRAFGLVVASLSVLLAVAVVGNIMLLAVYQQRRQIALKRAVGALASDIAFEQLVQAMTFGIIALVIALLFGYSFAAICRSVIDFEHQDFHGAFSPFRHLGISPTTVLSTLVASILVAVGATVPGIVRAIRMSPADQLR